MRDQWSKPFRVDSVGEETMIVPSGPGIYMIISKKPLHRVGGIDCQGILYVGKAFSLRDRLKKFWYVDHIASYFLWENLEVAKKIFRNSALSKKDLDSYLGSLYAMVCPVNKINLASAERAVLFCYLYNFGELPPLNFNLSKRSGSKPEKQLFHWAGQVIG